MPKKRKSFPSYVLHGQSGRARAVWTDSLGKRHEKLLPGKFESRESRLAYGRLVAELASNPEPEPLKPAGGPAGSFTINELCFAYLTQHAPTHYRLPDGSQSRALDSIKRAIKVLRSLYGETQATEFGPRSLKAVRAHMITPLEWSRPYINSMVKKIRQIFKWGASEELFPESVYAALKTVDGLLKGRTEARETAPVRPVEDAIVEKTIPFLSPHVKELVTLLWYTGARPSELAGLTLRCLDRTGPGPNWKYRPATHKTSHRDKDREISFGPRSQAVLTAHLAKPEQENLGLDDYVFSPRRGQQERFAAMRSKRKSKVQPSQASRRKKKAERSPGERFTRTAINNAIKRACDKAGVERWFTYQLRHTFATNVRREMGPEAAQTSLGHSHISTTEIYAERNRLLADEVAAKLG